MGTLSISQILSTVCFVRRSNKFCFFLVITFALKCSNLCKPVYILHCFTTVVYCFQMSIESDRWHDIVTTSYEIIHVVVSGKFSSKMCTGVHKLVLVKKMMFNAKESCKFNNLCIKKQQQCSMYHSTISGQTAALDVEVLLLHSYLHFL